FVCQSPLGAQTASLNLGSAVVASGATATVNLSLSGSAGPAGVQWALTYPSASVAALSVSPGPALTAAGKSLICSPAA
ncbi:hypothetical protein Q8G41_29090, partial [Klebsiella pneumoniae]|uniref:hypothetical protein n=1 Tax=Klebsiella pneumoniae TaxID=573 RepID=UPI003013B7AD